MHSPSATNDGSELDADFGFPKIYKMVEVYSLIDLVAVQPTQTPLSYPALEPGLPKFAKGRPPWTTNRDP